MRAAGDLYKFSEGTGPVRSKSQAKLASAAAQEDVDDQTFSSPDVETPNFARPITTMGATVY